MNANEQILALVVVGVLAFAVGYRRGIAKATAEISAGPVIGNGVDWLNWQS